MSGISGIWNTDGRPVDAALLNLISQQQSHRGPDAQQSWLSGSVGLSSQLLRNAPESAAEEQPFRYHNCIVVFDGRLDDREQLIAVIGENSFDICTPSPNLIAAAYLKFGEGFLAHLNGDFALAIFDVDEQRLLLARDAIGPRPLYYFKADATIVFASEVKALLAHPHVPRKPDRSALAEYLIGAQGQHSSNTFFRDIHRVLPGSFTAFSREGFVTRKYWDFNPAHKIRLKGFEEYADGLRFHFERAVQRRIRSDYPVAVFVSGGLDSSAIFCIAEKLRRAGKTPCPVIVGGTHSGPIGTLADELEFLTYIERDYGTRFVNVDRVRVRNLARSLAKVRETEMPELEMFASDHDALAGALKARGARTLLTGQWGDQVLAPQTYLVDFAYRLRWLTVWRHIHESRQWISEADPKALWNIFKNELAADVLAAHWPSALVGRISRVRARAVLQMRDSPWYTDSFRNEALRLGETHDLSWRRFPTAFARAFYKNLRGTSWLWSEEYDNKWVAQLGMDSAIPFLDRELLTFCLAIPPGAQSWDGVFKGLFRKAMEGTLPPEIRDRKWKGDVTALTNENMIACFDELVAFLDRSRMAQELDFVDGALVREELLRAKNELKDDGTTAWRMQGLAGLEQWLQTFFGENRELCQTEPAAADQKKLLRKL